jgi:hypothetical protein
VLLNSPELCAASGSLVVERSSTRGPALTSMNITEERYLVERMDRALARLSQSSRGASRCNAPWLGLQHGHRNDHVGC